MKIAFMAPAYRSEIVRAARWGHLQSWSVAVGDQRQLPLQFPVMSDPLFMGRPLLLALISADLIFLRPLNH
jgi:hypothetical protein